MAPVNYPRSYIDRAQEMHDAGASYNRIAETLGLGDSGGSTVHRWLDPEYAESVRQRVRLRHQRGRFVPGTRVPWVTAERMVAMRGELGMSYNGIAGAVSLYERKCSGATVKNVLKIVAPDLQAKPRGNPFGSELDPRGVTA